MSKAWVALDVQVSQVRATLVALARASAIFAFGFIVKLRYYFLCKKLTLWYDILWLNVLDHESKACVLDYAVGMQVLRHKTGDGFSYFFGPFRVGWEFVDKLV